MNLPTAPVLLEALRRKLDGAKLHNNVVEFTLTPVMFSDIRRALLPNDMCLVVSHAAKEVLFTDKDWRTFFDPVWAEDKRDSGMLGNILAVPVITDTELEVESQFVKHNEVYLFSYMNKGTDVSLIRFIRVTIRN